MGRSDKMMFEQFCTWLIGIICHLFSAGMGRRVKGQGFRSHLTLFKVWKMENITGPRTNVLLVLLHRRVGVHMSEPFFFFFKCSWYTVLYQFLLYSTVTQSHTHTHTHTHTHSFSDPISHHVLSPEIGSSSLCCTGGCHYNLLAYGSITGAMKSSGRQLLGVGVAFFSSMLCGFVISLSFYFYALGQQG